MSDGMTAAVHREQFELPGSGGHIIRGETHVVRGATRGVVLVHGFKGFYRGGFFPTLAAEIAAAGMNVVTFNFAGSGVGPDLETFTEHEAFSGNSLGRELYDLSLVLRESDARGWLGDRWGLLGHSRGGGVSVLHAARDERVSALVTWASISTVQRWSEQELSAWRERGYADVVNSRTGQVLRVGTRMVDEAERHGAGRLDIGRAAAKVRCPWLIVHGDADETVPFREGERLHEASRNAELLRIAGGTHSFNVTHGFSVVSPELRQVLDRTVSFLSQQVGER